MKNSTLGARSANASRFVARVILVAGLLALPAPASAQQTSTKGMKVPVAAKKAPVKVKARSAKKARTAKPVEAAAPAAMTLAAAPAPPIHPAPIEVNAQESFQLGKHLEEAGKPREAIVAYERAANASQGAPSGAAAKRLGEIFDTGAAGTPRDYETALRWYDKARMAGETVAKPGVYRTARGVN